MPRSTESVKPTFEPRLFILSPEQVDACFESAQHQNDYVLALYRLVFPDWDALVSVNGHPACSKFLWKLICDKAMTFDRLHHPTVMAGGAWLNWGFTTREHLTGWAVETCPVTRQEDS